MKHVIDRYKEIYQRLIIDRQQVKYIQINEFQK